MIVSIDRVKNCVGLENFEPVEGHWSVYDLYSEHEDKSMIDIEESVQNYMDADFRIRVSVFHLDGRAITGDVPSEGLFLAIRI